MIAITSTTGKRAANVSLAVLSTKPVNRLRDDRPRVLTCRLEDLTEADTDVMPLFALSAVFLTELTRMSGFAAAPIG